MNVLVYFSILLAMAALGLNCVFGFIAYSMAKKRSLKPLPVFFAAIFGSLAVVFFVGMFPVIVKKEEFPKDI